MISDRPVSLICLIRANICSTSSGDRPATARPEAGLSDRSSDRARWPPSAVPARQRAGELFDPLTKFGNISSTRRGSGCGPPDRACSCQAQDCREPWNSLRPREHGSGRAPRSQPAAGRNHRTFKLTPPALAIRPTACCSARLADAVASQNRDDLTLADLHRHIAYTLTLP